ncbi:hypothetical protein GCM10011514_09730 [Emticicia aquatilis]|uniref:Response regulatory domain-containing protein n=1 Tax=Emticicia aquatilis TaxID=1537369 RepID=A0A916YIV5_9BACT|nr:response regulator [Emticicia aquatilis]GGD47806.1 hypothetical protein GCM10011514_09730 [Emticicia aquatilis]
MILIVDDSIFNQQHLSIILSSQGYNYKVAANGKDAVELSLKEKFDLILMDIEMPIMNGIEASRKIRHKNNQNCNTPIILQSTSETTNELLRYKQLFNGRVIKPYSKDEIVTILDKYILNYNLFRITQSN